MGIDPGLSGGAFVYDTDTHEFRSYLLESNDGKLDVIKLCDWLVRQRPDHVFIEQIFLAGREGGRSAMTIGSNYGRITSACEFTLTPYTEVMPKVWQRSLGLKAPSRKELKAAAGKLAIERFTMMPFLTGKKNKIHDGLTDAACIALYGVKVWTENQLTKSTQSSAQSMETSAKKSSTSKKKSKKLKKPSKSKSTKQSKPLQKPVGRSAKSSTKLKRAGKN
jgi:hypothetical protein